MTIANGHVKWFGYFTIVFPIITIHNLIVISIEKYFSLRRVPRPLSFSTVRKLIFMAWFLGFFTTLLPAATFNVTRYDLNDTVICKYDGEYLPFRFMSLSLTVIEYVMPSILLIVIGISLNRTVWVSVRTNVSSQVNNPIREKLLKFVERSSYCSFVCFYHSLCVLPGLRNIQHDRQTRY